MQLLLQLEEDLWDTVLKWVNVNWESLFVPLLVNGFPNEYVNWEKPACFPCGNSLGNQLISKGNKQTFPIDINQFDDCISKGLQVVKVAAQMTKVEILNR
jgi:hypothetical protein